MQKLFPFVLCFFTISFLSGYYNQDPVMISVSGAYNTLSSGYQCVGVNPGNLAFSKGVTMNLGQFNLNFKNNFITQKRLDDLKGANLEDPSSYNYYPKNKILDYLKGEPIRNTLITNIPSSFLSFSNNSFAMTSEIKVFSDVELSQDFFKFVLYGNEIDSTYNFFINSNSFIILESSVSKAYKVNNIGIGFTIKYLKGLVGYSYLTLENPEFITTATDINLSGSSYLLRQNTMGHGFGLDFGISTDRSSKGWKFGISFINVLSSVNWNHKTTIDKQMMDFYEDIYSQTELQEKENKFLSLSIENLTVDDLNNDDVDLSDLFVVNEVNMYEGSVLPQEYENLNYEFSTITNNYYIPSDSLCNNSSNPDCSVDLKLNQLEENIIKFDYPTMLSIGISKKINDRQLYMLDISTGLDDSFNNKEKWRVAVGGEFGTKVFPFRLGLSYGGYDKMSVGMGFGLHIPSNKGSFGIDFGISYKGNIDVNSANGFDFGLGLYWTQN